MPEEDSITLKSLVPVNWNDTSELKPRSKLPTPTIVQGGMSDRYPSAKLYYVSVGVLTCKPCKPINELSTPSRSTTSSQRTRYCHQD